MMLTIISFLKTCLCYTNKNTFINMACIIGHQLNTKKTKMKESYVIILIKKNIFF